MSVIQATAGEVSKVPNGTYLVECYKVEDQTLPNAQFGNGEVVKIFVTLPEGPFQEDGSETHLDAIANRKLTPKSKLWGWSTAFGCDIAVGMAWDTEDLVGRRALARVENEEKDQTLWPRIIDIFPEQQKAESLRKADGTADLNVFWKEVKVLGKAQSDVRDLGHDLNRMGAKSVSELEEILRFLGKPKEHIHDPAYDAAGSYICRSCGERLKEPA